jgi:hypothetical protein
MSAAARCRFFGLRFAHWKSTDAASGLAFVFPPVDRAVAVPKHSAWSKALDYFRSPLDKREMQRRRAAIWTDSGKIVTTSVSVFGHTLFSLVGAEDARAALRRCLRSVNVCVEIAPVEQYLLA